MHINVCKEIKHLYTNFSRGLIEFMLHPSENYDTGSNSCPVVLTNCSKSGVKQMAINLYVPTVTTISLKTRTRAASPRKTDKYFSPDIKLDKNMKESYLNKNPS